MNFTNMDEFLGKSAGFYMRRQLCGKLLLVLPRRGRQPGLRVYIFLGSKTLSKVEANGKNGSGNERNYEAGSE